MAGVKPGERMKRLYTKHSSHLCNRLYKPNQTTWRTASSSSIEGRNISYTPLTPETMI
jgi:hypothetical protein